MMDSFSRTRLAQEIFVRGAAPVIVSNAFPTWSDFAKRCIQLADSFEKAQQKGIVVMNGLALNLGPFNRCADDVSKVARVEYPVDFYRKGSQQTRVFYYSNESTIKSQEVSNTFVLPTFQVGNQSDQSYGEESCEEVIHKIELRIISMIYAIIKQMNIPLCLDRIVIPVKSIRIHCDTESNTPYGWAEVGIAIFV